MARVKFHDHTTTSWRAGAPDRPTLDEHCLPFSVQTYSDLAADAKERARLVLAVRQHVAVMLREWRRARRHPAKPGAGGSVYHRPCAVVLCRYGANVYARRADAVTA